MKFTNKGSGVVVLTVAMPTPAAEYAIGLWTGHSYDPKGAAVVRIDRDPVHSTAKNVRVEVGV